MFSGGWVGVRAWSYVDICHLVFHTRNGKKINEDYWRHRAAKTLVATGSYNGLSPLSRKAITCSRADLLLTKPLGASFSDNYIKIYIKKELTKCTFGKSCLVDFVMPQCVTKREWSCCDFDLMYITPVSKHSILSTIGDVKKRAMYKNKK